MTLLSEKPLGIGDYDFYTHWYQFPTKVDIEISEKSLYEGMVVWMLKDK